MLMLAMTLALTLTANMAKADDSDDYLDAMAAYQNGDYATAFKLFKSSADQGHLFAQYNLGVMYRFGEGVIEDYKEAAKWYHLAADQGLADAQHHLGVMYQNGHGVLQDNKKAHMWYNIARSRGSYWVHYNIKSISRWMTPADISKAQDMARQCLASDYQDC